MDWVLFALGVGFGMVLGVCLAYYFTHIAIVRLINSKNGGD